MAAWRRTPAWKNRRKGIEVKFWLMLLVSIVSVLITPALERFSTCYGTVARKIGEMLPQYRWVTISVSLAVTSIISILYAIYYYKESRKSFKSYLRPVSGKGYCIDKRFNEPVCPKCAANDAETFLQVLRSKNPGYNDSLFCGVCCFSTELDSCWIKEHDKAAAK